MNKKITHSASTLKFKSFILFAILILAGSFQKVAAQDMGVISIVSPIGVMCAHSNQTVSVIIKNFDTVATDFSLNPVSVTVNINGASNQTFSVSLNTGSLDMDSTLTIIITSNADFTNAGNHLFNSYTTIGGDYNATNDTNNVHYILINPLPTLSINSSATASNACYGTLVTLNGVGASTYSWDNGISDGVAFSDTITTTFTVIGIDTNGCENNTFIIINVNDTLIAPTITSTSTSDSVCAGDSIKLSGAGALSYTWDNGVTDNVYFIPIATTTYQVIGIDTMGCANSSSKTITFRPLPNIIINSSGTAANACNGTPITLSGGGASTYSWDNGISDGVTFIDTVTRTFTVTGIDLFGCINSSSITIVVDTLMAPTITATSTNDSICPGDSVKLNGAGGLTYLWDNGITNNQFFTPLNTSTYNVIGIDTSGCANTSSKTITFRTLPNVGSTINPSSAVVCMGSHVTLFGSGASTYLWSGGAINGAPIAITSPITFTVTGTDSHGCKNTDTQTVSMFALPTVTLTPFPYTVCAQVAPFALTGGLPIGGTYSGIGVDTNYFHPSSAGAIQGIFYTYTDTNSCVNSATQNMHVQDCTGIEEINNDQDISIYPNPTNGLFTIEITNSSVSELFISIIDLQGKEIYSAKEKSNASNFHLQINIAEIAKGFYYLKLNSSDRVFVKKLVIQ